MEEKIRKYKGTMSKAQKIRFFEFCLEIYTTERKVNFLGESLFNYGFCNIYHYYFNEPSYAFGLIPELFNYKPNIFYNSHGDMTRFSDQFWFPRRDNSERIKICKSILKELKNG